VLLSENPQCRFGSSLSRTTAPPSTAGRCSPRCRPCRARSPPQGSGRTDAGVHALGQVASFTLVTNIPAENLLRALNRALPPAIRVYTAGHAPEGFHARHSALRKSYEYRILRPANGICSPFLAPYGWHCPWTLDPAPLRQAAAAILGEHDFTSFAAADPDLSTRLSEKPTSAIRILLHSDWTVEPESLTYRVTGTGFLHHMVRNLVGTMVDIGAGRTDPNQIAAILAARVRSAAGPTAPAHGLFLVEVDYP
jgi:tRNA pseudouridine38-40 synthase